MNESSQLSGGQRLAAAPCSQGIYCVLEVVEGRPGRLLETEGWDDALRVAVECVKSVDPASAAVTPDEEILRELKSDTNWSSNQGDIWVYILQTERVLIPANDQGDSR